MTDLFIPGNFDPPTAFLGPGFHLEPLGPEHNDRDHEAWTSSMDHIHSTPGEWGQWPRPMTLEENMADMEMHDRADVIGCLYIYPDENGASDAHVSSWVRKSRAEMDVVVWRSVSAWLESDWPFESFRYAAR